MSDHNITLRAADDVSLDLVADLLQRAFADYIAPVAFSTSTLLATSARDDILLARSYVAYADGAPVGVALVAVRPSRHGPRTRVAGMGVVPAARRAGVARALLERVIADARGRGAPALALEAFEHNTAARRLYEAYGFAVTRRLLGFTLARASFPVAAGNAVTLRAVDAPALLPLFSLCAASEPPDAAPPWQVEAPSLARLGPAATVYALVAPDSPRPAGYVAVAGEGPSARLVGLGVAPARRRRGLATAGLAAAFARHPGIAALTAAPLVPQASALVPFLAACGAAPAPDAQVEMTLTL